MKDRGTMKNTALLALLAVMAASLPAQAARLSWTPGWDNFSEPLNTATSNVTYSLSTKQELTVMFTLNGATPSKAYQVAILLFNQCPNVPTLFGQFPDIADDACAPYTRQNVTLSTSSTELAVVTTDASGNGSTTVAVGPLAPGSYAVEFVARDGVGCNVSGGNANACAVDFQSPGPIFGTTTTITVP